MKRNQIGLGIVTSVILTTALQADTIEDRLKALEAKISSIEETNALLTEEITTLENEKWYASVDITQSQSGLGAAASKVYYSQNPLSIGGYGEFYFSDTNGVIDAQNGQNSAITDTYRFVPYIGYKFSDNIILNSELEFEHGGSTVAIEFLYLDFLFNQYANLRLGQQLVPMGLVNLQHEPTLYPTVLRPDVETYLIPSTWNEMGVSIYGETDSIAYQVGIINALNLNSTDTQTNSKKWIRNARRGSAEKIAMNSLAVVARGDYTGIEGTKLGASFYYGDASNTDDGVGNIDGTSMLIYEMHATYKQHSFFANALYTKAHLYGADKIGPQATEEAAGFYVNAGYNFFARMDIELPFFVQYEQYNYAKSTVNDNPAKEIRNTTFGLNYFPHEQVVLKSEYKIVDDKNIQDAKIHVISLGAGFIF